MHKKVLITGTNDIATACALRLFRSGFAITMISHNIPMDLYYFRNYSTVLASGSKMISNIKAQSYSDYLYNLEGKTNKTLNEFVVFSLSNRQIAIVNQDEIKKITTSFDYMVICDEVLFGELDINISEIISISCVSKEYNFSKYNIILSGPKTGQVNYPFLEYDYAEKESKADIIYATEEGVFVAEKSPGDKINKNEKIAMLGESVIKSNSAGYLTGIMRSGLIIPKGQAVACISGEADEDIKEFPATAVSISGAVLEAVMYDMHINK